MTPSKTLLALDVGTVRIGVAKADTAIKIAVALETINVDGNEFQTIGKIIRLEQPDKIIVGFPRNQSGEATKQTNLVEEFTQKLQSKHPDLEIIFQDESLTSVHAEAHLKSEKKNYTKADIDKLAAALILQDYLEINYA